MSGRLDMAKPSLEPFQGLGIWWGLFSQVEPELGAALAQLAFKLLAG
jgi:hypothetical protein